jgi:glycine cleavage system H protein
MSKPLVFMMGRSPAFLPTDRSYLRNHMWALEVPGGWRFGLTAYAVKLLGDIHCLEWSVSPGSVLDGSQPIGFIEGSKATSDLYSPMAGRVLELNDAVLTDPTLLSAYPDRTGVLGGKSISDYIKTSGGRALYLPGDNLDLPTADGRYFFKTIEAELK